MKFWIVLLFGFLAMNVALADDKIASAQQLLKDQGFYYGEINGEKDADTIAAIRRYQIRNGLQISGELSDETLKALQTASSAAAATPVPSTAPNRNPVATHTPPLEPDTSDLRDDSARAPAPEEAQQPTRRLLPPEQGDPQPPVYPGRIARPGGNFTGTPYENSSAEIQRDVVARAQKTLARRNLFKGEINGVFTSDLEFSLRAYQSRVGLERTGRLDLQTLAALELLPGAHEPIYTPRRGLVLPPGAEPPVRGEWIRP